MDGERDFTTPDQDQLYFLSELGKTVSYAEMTAEIDPMLLPSSSEDLALLFDLMGATPVE